MANAVDNGEFVTELTQVRKEVKKFIWRINSFPTIIKDGHPNPEIHFKVGESIGHPSKWKLEVYPFASNRICLQINRTWSGDSHDAGHFKFKATIKRNDNRGMDWVSIELNPNRGANHIGTLEELVKNALIGDDLAIHVEFVVGGPDLVTTMREGRTEESLIGGVLENYGNLLESGDNSDFVIKVKGTELKVTTLILQKRLIGLVFII